MTVALESCMVRIGSASVSFGARGSWECSDRAGTSKVSKSYHYPARSGAKVAASA